MFSLIVILEIDFYQLDAREIFLKEIDANNPANKWESIGTKDGIIIHSKPSDNCKLF